MFSFYATQRWGLLDIQGLPQPVTSEPPVATSLSHCGRLSMSAPQLDALVPPLPRPLQSPNLGERALPLPQSAGP